MEQICQGMSYLQSLPTPVIHGDLKVANVLVDAGIVLKVNPPTIHLHGENNHRHRACHHYHHPIIIFSHYCHHNHWHHPRRHHRRLLGTRLQWYMIG